MTIDLAEPIEPTSPTTSSATRPSRGAFTNEAVVKERKGAYLESAPPKSSGGNRKLTREYTGQLRTVARGAEGSRHRGGCHLEGNFPGGKADLVSSSAGKRGKICELGNHPMTFDSRDQGRPHGYG